MALLVYRTLLAYTYRATNGSISPDLKKRSRAYSCSACVDQQPAACTTVCEYGVSPFTTVEEYDPNDVLSIDFIKVSLRHRRQLDSKDRSYRLLTPTMPILLLQAARGISSGYNCWLLAIIGPGGLRSAIHEKACMGRGSIVFFQAHKLVIPRRGV